MSARSLAHAAMVLLLAGSALAAGSTMHPPVELKDARGIPVLQSGQPVSPMESCGTCHDARYIAGHSFHTTAAFSGMAAARGTLHDPLAYDGRRIAGLAPADGDRSHWLATAGQRHAGGGPSDSLAGGGVEMDCFLCHLATADHGARGRALAAGQFPWVNTATLAATGLVTPREDGSWNWVADAFDSKGLANAGVMPLVDPAATACGPCHMVTGEGLDSPLFYTPGPDTPRGTRLNGVVYSPQRIRDSGLNLAGKDGLDQPWDIHAERGLECVDCHHSLDNPVYREESRDTRPDHLDFDARRASLADYLKAPSHQFARGHASGTEEAAPFDHTMRRCESCHDEQGVHDWLPFAQSHFNALSCEACHIPTLHAPALQVIDWSVPDGGEPRLELRGAKGDPASPYTLTEGYHPVLLPRKDADGRSRLAPFNLVSSWYWTRQTDAGREVVPLDLLEAALAPGGVWSAAVLALLDTDGNGSIDEPERTPRREDQVRVLKGILQSAGMRDPQLEAQTDAIPVSHGVAGPGHATKECATCHGQDSRLKASLVLATAWPGGVLPRWTAGDAETAADITPGTTGELLFTGSGAGAFVLGHDHRPWVNLIGMGSLLLVLLLILVHGTLRWRAARHLGRTAHVATERVYMYGRYERFWHWLQALAIAGLIFTGLTVHAPDVFRFGSFQAAVQVHNVLGFVLLANAFFSLFYHVAGGSVRQYLPTPRGFFNQAIRQVLYYTRDIFKGGKHPFEKTPGRKLNPLQKVVYLLILNVLLPFQILGGILIWGAQHWPELADRLGGLALLVPLHSLGAWLFASFLVMHIYLTTTGHTVTSNLRAMVSGFEQVPRTEPEETQR